MSQSVVNGGRLMRDGAANAAGFLLPTALGIIIIPVILRRFGVSGYGVWAALTSTVGMMASIDLGFGRAFTRDVAASAATSDRPIAIARAMATAFLGLGLVRAALFAVLGFAVIRRMDVTAEIQETLPSAIGWFGATVFAESLQWYGTAVLQGRSRFTTVNIVTVVFSTLKNGGLLVLLGRGASLPTLSAWVAIITIATTLVVLEVAGQQRAFAFRPGRSHWGEWAPHVGFGLATQLDQVLSSLTGNGLVLLIGATLGSTGAAVYHIAQRIPATIATVASRYSDVLFPAAARARGESPAARAEGGELLVIGIEILAAFILPAAATVWLVADPFMQLWTQSSSPTLILITRLLTVAACIGSIGLVPVTLLWGWGRVRRILTINIAYAVVHLALIAMLAPVIGLVGTGWAAAAGEMVSTSLLLTAALQLSDTPSGQPWLRLALAGAVSLTTSGLVAFALSTLGVADSWARVGGASIMIGSAGLVSFAVVSGLPRHLRAFLVVARRAEDPNVA